MPPLKIRPEVMRFAEAMEKKLRKNDHKGGWEDCDYEYLIDNVDAELEEAQEEFKELEPYYHSSNGPLIKTAEELVDVANFCMMFYDNAQEEVGNKNPYAEKRKNPYDKEEKPKKKPSRFEGIIT